MRKLSLYIAIIMCFCDFSKAQQVNSTVYNEYAFVYYEYDKTTPDPSDNTYSKRPFYASRIINYFPEQLTNPEKKKRHSYSQFGYIFPMREFIVPGNFGKHSYGQPDRGEKNGCIYTCKGGFIDFSHLRVALDWTVYLTFRMITEEGNFDLPPEAGRLELHFKNTEKLNLEDISTLAQKIAFERLLWHEVASWHYHRPHHFFSEQLSAFTPEDLYSNFVGTVIGKKVALHLLNNTEGLSYSEVANEEIEKYILSLEPLPDKKGTIKAYKIVDFTRQQKLPEVERNNDVWWESSIIFIDQRYVFKRYMDIGPQLKPWLVPAAETLGCQAYPDEEILKIPQKTKAGKLLNNYYEFRISPDKKLFTSTGPQKHRHPPFEPFLTRDFEEIVEHVGKQMEGVLGKNYDKRNKSVTIAGKQH